MEYSLNNVFPDGAPDEDINLDAYAIDEAARDLYKTMETILRHPVRNTQEAKSMLGDIEIFEKRAFPLAREISDIFNTEKFSLSAASFLFACAFYSAEGIGIINKDADNEKPFMAYWRAIPTIKKLAHLILSKEKI